MVLHGRAPKCLWVFLKTDELLAENGRFSPCLATKIGVVTSVRHHLRNCHASRTFEARADLEQSFEPSPQNSECLEAGASVARQTRSC
jgi:hypothetical protein